MKSKLKLIIIAFLGTTSVLPTLLWGTFLFDDGEAILKNALVTQPETEHFTKIFKHDFWGVEITHPHSHKSYRPLTTLTYRFDYSLFGKNAFAFHLINWIIHGINCCLVFIFIKKCLIMSYCKQHNLKSLEKLAFWTSVLFAVHPVHVEALGSCVGRADLISSLIFLIGFIIIPENHFVTPWLIGFFAIFGALFKENAIVLSIFSVIMDFGVKNKCSVSKNKFIQYFITVLLTGSFVIWRLWFQNWKLPYFQTYDNPPVFTNSTFTKHLLTCINICILNLQISSITYIWSLNAFTLVNPIWLCYDWSMGCVKLIESFCDYRLILTILFGVLCGAVLIRALNSREIMIATLLTGITFLPSSNLIFTVGFVLAERNLYLPSIGYSLMVAYAFLKKRRIHFLVYVVIIFYARSVQRSTHWINETALFKSGLHVCPSNAKVHYNLGTMYAAIPDVNLAETSYKTALSLRPDYYQAMNNLGNLIRPKDLVEAEYWLRKAVELKTDFAAAWMNLGIVLSKKNQSEALMCYQNALKHRKKYPDCQYNLGNLYLDMGDNESALKSWRTATSLKPSHVQGWINTVILLEQQEKLQKAKEVGLKALKALDDCDTLHFIMGNVFGKLSEYEEAHWHFKKAISICQSSGKNIPAKYFTNLGVLYHRWPKQGNKVYAEEAYMNALKIDPTLESARKNLKLLKL